jgi:hypothetical protein
MTESDLNMGRLEAIDLTGTISTCGYDRGISFNIALIYSTFNPMLIISAYTLRADISIPQI